MNSSVRAGFTANLPVAAGVGAYGSVLGVLAAQKGVSWASLMLMNLSIFAGSAQFVMVDMWMPSLPILEMTLAVLAINMRYLLIGASLRPVFEGRSLRQKLMGMHLVADENWAVTMAEYRKGNASLGFLIGGGVCLLIVWSAGTMVGHALGAVIRNPEAFALDFAFVAVFLGLAVGMWRGKGDILPWAVAIAAAVVTEKLLPGKWYIVSGGIFGAGMAAFSGTNTNREETT